jgi:hypothetical protein
MTQTRREIIQAFVPNSPLVGHLADPDGAVIAKGLAVHRYG